MKRKVRNYIGGTWTNAEGNEFLDVENPSNGEILAEVPLSTAADIDRAVSAARAAFPGWSGTPVSDRCEPLQRLAELIRENREPVARIISEEMGKSLPDARAELARCLENCRVACGMPTLIQGDKVADVRPGIDGEVIRVPIGVFAAITPFNFPAMVPFWFIPYALAAGNTFLVKPSEQVPLTMERLFGLIDACGFPPGVVNLVNGDKRTSKAILEHPDIEGVSFVGSSKVGRTVAEVCASTGKRFQAFGSAKNYMVVMPDARMDETIRNMLTSCFGCAGQRCMAASAIACIGEEVYERVLSGFVEAARQVKVGNPLDQNFEEDALVVGPVISAAAKRRIESLIETAVDEGANLLLNGCGVNVKGGENGHFIGPSILADVRPGMTVEKTELFGPVVVIMKFASLEDAIRAINNHQYGNGASIYTQNGYHARKFKLEVKAGMIGVNIGIPAPVAFLPFGGTKASLRADIKAQGKDIVGFFTERKVVTERFWPER